MIRLVVPLALDGRFSLQDLPDELQLPLLNNMVVPRVVSSSMAPTIQEGDRLELSPPTSLHIGAIILFRSETLLICHRIIAIDGQGGLSTKGDATDGTGEVVQPTAVIATVTGVRRNDTHISFGEYPHRYPSSHPATEPKKPFRRIAARWAGSIIHAFTRHSIFRNVLTLLLRKGARIDISAPAPLQSFPSHFRVTSFSIREFQAVARALQASNGPQPAQYVLRLGPWRLAQYDPTTQLLRLRQSLQEAGLEPFIRQCCEATQPSPH